MPESLSASLDRKIVILSKGKDSASPVLSINVHMEQCAGTAQLILEPDTNYM